MANYVLERFCARRRLEVSIARMHMAAGRRYCRKCGWVPQARFRRVVVITGECEACYADARRKRTAASSGAPVDRDGAPRDTAAAMVAQCAELNAWIEAQPTRWTGF